MTHSYTNNTPRTGNKSTRKSNISPAALEILEARREVMARSDGKKVEYTEQVEKLLGGKYTQTQIAEVVWRYGLRYETAFSCIKAALPQTIQWADREGLSAAHE